MKTVIIGDSFTEGMPGAAYWNYFYDKSQLINKGVCGDTLYGASKRVMRMLHSKDGQKIDHYIIQIGTNDVLLPVLMKHSKYWKRVVKVKGCLFGSIPCRDINDFKIGYEQLILTLLRNKKKVGIIGLPLVENSLLRMDDTMQEYHVVVQDLARKYHLGYVDLRAWEIWKKKENQGTYFYGKTNLGNFIDTVFTSFLPFGNTVSKMRGLAVTVDGIHPNKSTAKALAKLIENQLKCDFL
ncbi:MAG: GDSL-type esterase/lipase family protein [Lachnospiraceae bacterium]